MNKGIYGFPQSISRITYDLQNLSPQDGVMVIEPMVAVQAGDIIVGGFYDGAPKPLFPTARVPASYETVKAPTDSIYSPLITATLSTAHNQMSVCPTASGGFACAVASASSSSSMSLFVFSPDNVLLSNTTPVTSLTAQFNNGDQNFGLAELTNGGFVLGYISGGTGYVAQTYPFGGGTPFLTKNLGAASGIALASTSDGGFVVFKTAASPSLTKYNAAGTQQWTATVGANTGNNRAVIELANNYIAACWSNSCAIYDASGNVVRAAGVVPGIAGNECTATPLSGGGLVIASKTNGGGNFQHTILTNTGTTLAQFSTPGSIGLLRGHPCGGYLADASNGTTFYGYGNDGVPTGRTPGSYYPLPLNDGKIAVIRLNTAASQLVTEVFAGTGSIYGVALEDGAANSPVPIRVEGSATVRTNMKGGGSFSHGNKIPAGNGGAIVGLSAILKGY